MTASCNQTYCIVVCSQCQHRPNTGPNLTWLRGAKSWPAPSQWSEMIKDIFHTFYKQFIYQGFNPIGKFSGTISTTQMKFDGKRVSGNKIVLNFCIAVESSTTFCNQHLDRIWMRALQDFQSIWITVALWKIPEQNGTLGPDSKYRCCLISVENLTVCFLYF